jgi:hypothetical protein
VRVGVRKMAGPQISFQFGGIGNLFPWPTESGHQIHTVRFAVCDIVLQFFGVYKLFCFPGAVLQHPVNRAIGSRQRITGTFFLLRWNRFEHMLALGAANRGTGWCKPLFIKGILSFAFFTYDSHVVDYNRFS